MELYSVKSLSAAARGGSGEKHAARARELRQLEKYLRSVEKKIRDPHESADPTRTLRVFTERCERSKLPTAPLATHLADPDDDLPPRRPAADIIDWSDLGDSLWTRDLENPRVTPTAQNTMARIAEGIRRHCSDRLAPFADVLETIDPATLEELRETVVPPEYAPIVADTVDEPFLVAVPSGPAGLAAPSVVKYYGTSTVTPADRPLDTVRIS